MKLLKNRITKTVGVRDEYGRLAGTKEVDEWEWSLPKIIIASVLALILLLMLISCISTVPTGYTGILTTFGRVEDRTMGAGVHFIAPWQKIVKLDNRTQKVEITAQAFSSDIQQVDLKMSVNYCIDQATAQNLYKTVGKQYYDTVLYPRILENTKSVFAKYSAEELVSHRQDLSGEIQKLLTADATQYGIQIVNFSVEDIDRILSHKTDTAIFDLEVTKIQADAAEYAGLKEAARIQAIAKSLTPEVITYYRTLQWDGKLPATMLSDNVNYLLGQ